MISFTRAATVAKGERPTSSQLSSLCRAINDRLLSGLGDGAWRIGQFWYNLWRQVRNPDEGGYAFPAMGEFFHVYQHLDPEQDGDVTWPVTGPGEPEGANLGNFINQFVFGNPDMPDEPSRLSAVDLLGPAGLSGPEWYWETGKAQRGAVDPDAGLQAAPALAAAQDFMRIARFMWSPHGAAYGGFFPTPIQLVADCSQGSATPETDPGYLIPSYEIFFTALRADVPTAGLHGTITTPGGIPKVTYSGSCPCGSAQYAAGHVIWLWQGPLSYYVYVGTGTGCEYDVDVLPLADWIIGPFTGDGRLQHSDGHQLDRAISAFAQDFRGDRAQRAMVPCFGDAGNQLTGSDEVKIRKVGADFQRFLTVQYPLAPNLGAKISDQAIEARYPRATWAGSQPAGAEGVFIGGGTSHVYRAGFVCAGVFAKATGLGAPCSVSFVDSGEAFASLTLEPDVDGNASAIAWLGPGRAVGMLAMVLPQGASSRAPGLVLTAEATEQQEMKPDWWDSYLVLRLGASQGGEWFMAGVDGRGKDCNRSKAILDALLTYGCIVNPGVAGVRDQAEFITSNPVYDTARRLCRDHVRVLRRQAFVAYEVAGGKSVLYFRRWAYGLHKNCRADLFHGIAPPPDPVQTLIVGQEYVVRSANGNGLVRHAGQVFAHGATFTAESPDFVAEGDGLVYVRDGIRAAAGPKRWSNRWCCWVESKCYNLSATSVWKPEAYADYYDFTDRCHYRSGTMNQALRVHATYSREVALDADLNPYLLPEKVTNSIVAPEAPTGYRYVGGSNQTYGSDDFCRSCQIYEPPLEVESCVVDQWGDDEIVKLTFASRFRCHADAPATVARDPNTWSAGEKAGLVAESYRTPDNALREYSLFCATLGGTNCSFKTGDQGTGAPLTDVSGACFPTCFLVALMPEPYDDHNDTQEKHDTRRTVDALMQAELYLRAMCEGFVDGRTSVAITCATGTGGLYDYTWENLCYDAFGGRWISALPEELRPEKPSGFGVQVNTRPYADIFNALTACVNLLTRARLEVPFIFQTREHHYAGTLDIANPLPAGVSCTTAGDMRAWADRPALPGVSWVSDGSWTTAAGASASESTTMHGCGFHLDRDRWEYDYRIQVNPSFQYAVRADLQELLDNSHTGFLARRYDDYVVWNERQEVGAGSGDPCSPPSDPDWFFDPGPPVVYQHWEEHEPIEPETCVLLSSGTLQSRVTPPSDYSLGRRASHTPGTFCGAVLAGAGVTIELKAAQLGYFEIPLTDP